MKAFNRKIIIISICLISFLGFIALNRPVNGFSKKKELKMKITSVFANGEKIPSIYTCDGENLPPEITINGSPPAKTKSLALIVDDPDSPSGIFTHWILYNIPPNTTKINSKDLPKEAFQGINDFGQIGYGGPCPPSGTHRYYFKLYALDAMVSRDKLIKSQLEQEINGHILGKTELMGKYSRK